MSSRLRARGEELRLRKTGINTKACEREKGDRKEGKTRGNVAGARTGQGQAPLGRNEKRTQKK